MNETGRKLGLNMVSSENRPKGRVYRHQGRPQTSSAALDGLNRRLDAMQRKRRMVVPRPRSSVEDEIAPLRGPIQRTTCALEACFKGRHMPAMLNAAPCCFAVIALRIQADSFGDLDHETRKVLDRTVAKEGWGGNVPAWPALTRSGELS